MKSQSLKSAIPTNIITGFLGAGKTTAILHLLKSKPSSERWAVLVNEFGEIGVDGSLFESQLSTGPGEQRSAASKGVYIREVPGGCMCCSAGFSMQFALAELIARAKPDRLLIEPTGLGHPLEVLQILAADHYRDIISLEKILTLVDARQLADESFAQNSTFKQQVEIADIVIGNKEDLYQSQDLAGLKRYVELHCAQGTQLVLAKHGAVTVDILSGETAAKVEQTAVVSPAQAVTVADADIPQCGYLKATNQGEGFRSVGWRFSPDIEFDYKGLYIFLNSIEALRVKAVFITSKGIFTFNRAEDVLSEYAVDECYESRIEIIAQKIDDDWDEQLMNCIT